MRRKTRATDALTTHEETFLRLVHAGKTNHAAVEEVWPGRYKRAAAKGSTLRNDPRAKTFLAALQEADTMRVRRIVEEKGCGYEHRIAALADAFNRQAASEKGAVALVKIHDKLCESEGRTKEKARARSIYLTLVQKPGADTPDPLQLPGVLGRVCEDPDEEARPPTPYLQQDPAGPRSPAN